MRIHLGTRSAGVLLHPTSLPGPFGIGDLGPEAHRFAEILRHSGQSWWQMLPVVPPGAGNSPYSAFSAFAGNPLLISLDVLARKGYLASEDLVPPGIPEGRVDFVEAEKFKMPRLRKAYEAFLARSQPAERHALGEYRSRNAKWLEDYALFEALRKANECKPWTQWKPALRRRRDAALAAARKKMAGEIGFQEFLQYEFHLQWEALRRHCRELGIALIGDVPIFVAQDSADVWAQPELFWVDDDGRPLRVAGVPPDYFSKTGQLWGNPLYRWDVLREQGYSWWIERFKTVFERFDAVRLDHFIGFHNYWEIPAGSLTAENGKWVPGPGAELFEKAKEALGPLQFIAEDLGIVTQGVVDLRERLGFPGIKVLQFCFGSEAPEEEPNKPHHFPRRCVVYTGTHDNDTTVGWFREEGGPGSPRSREAAESERHIVRRYLSTDGRDIHWDMISLAFRTAPDTAIIPIQDLLGLGSEARMNVPGLGEGNWAWRMAPGAFDESISERLRGLTQHHGRLPEGKK